MAAKTINVGGSEISIPTGLLINGEFVEVQGKATFGIENPLTCRDHSGPGRRRGRCQHRLQSGPENAQNRGIPRD
jgi:hypothetical protein